MKNPIGRPTVYSEELAEKICDAIATNAKGLEQICDENPGFPCPRTIQLWAFRNLDFFRKYMQARKFQSHKLMDKSIDVANDDEEDTLIKINRARIKVDVYKYNAVKLNPETYASRQKNSDEDSRAEALKDLE